MGRLVKHIGARVTPVDAATVLCAIPFFPGEKIKNLHINGYFASAADSAIDQPGEINWYGISIPWQLVWTTNLLDGGGIETMATVADIDQLYTQWLRSVAEAADETWGGDINADLEIDTGEEIHTDELLDSGPIGVHKFLNREVLMTPLAAEGNTVIRFGDAFIIDTGRVPSAAMGGLLLVGVVRFEEGAETNFNVEMDTTTHKEALGLMMSGDYTKVKAKIEGDTSSVGDYIRTILFGGDMYVEASTLKGPAGNGFIKMTASIDSPLSRRQ